MAYYGPSTVWFCAGREGATDSLRVAGLKSIEERICQGLRRLRRHLLDVAYGAVLNKRANLCVTERSK